MAFSGVLKVASLVAGVLILLALALVGAVPAGADVGPGGHADRQPVSAPVIDGASSLAQMSPPSSGDAAQVAAAQRQAAAAGKPVPVGSLTSGTSVMLAMPHGGFQFRENVLPVRVRRGRAWVGVDTSLVRVRGRWVAAAVPGDSVSFSGGGSGPLAVIVAGKRGLALTWPERLPVPVVAGASATFRNVFRGVDLVLTATARETGGFSEVLVVHSAAAALNPALRSLALRVSVKGAGPLRVMPGGGLLSAATDDAGYFGAAAPVMWDSQSLAMATPRRQVSADAAADRAAGGWLAGQGEAAGAKSSAAGPAVGARMARVHPVTSWNGAELVLVPDAAMLSSRSTVFPVFIDPSPQWWESPGGVTKLFDEVQSACRVLPTGGPTTPIWIRPLTGLWA